MAKKKTEPKPLLEITAKNLIREKHKFHLGTSSRMYKEYCHLIDSIANHLGWNLALVEWIHKDGTKYKGLCPIEGKPETLSELKLRVMRDLQKKGTPIKTFYSFESDKYPDSVLVVVRRSKIANVSYKNFEWYCIKYYHIGDNHWKCNIDYYEEEDHAFSWTTKALTYLMENEDKD